MQAASRFEEFLEAIHIPLSSEVTSLTPAVATQFVQWLENRPAVKGDHLTKSRIRVYLSGVMGFFTFLVRTKRLDFTTSEWIDIHEAFHGLRRGHRRQTAPTPREEVIDVLISTARRIEPYEDNPRLELARLRNIAILEILRSTGIRVGELVGLRLGGLNKQERSAHIALGGSRNRTVFPSQTAWQAMQSYLGKRSDKGIGQALDELPVFARHDRRSGGETLPLTTESVRQIFARIAKAAGIEISMTPHSLRHAFATRVLEATGDLAVVQDMLGHSSPDTTRIYAKVSSKRMRDAHRAAFDDARTSESEQDPTG